MEKNTQEQPTQIIGGYKKSAHQQASVFTLLIYFRNGYTRGMKFHSKKQEERKIAGMYVKDHRYAFNRLMHLIEKEFEGKYKTAVIYHNESGEEICKYAYGQCKSKMPIEWSVDEQGNTHFQFGKIIDISKIQQRVIAMHDANQYKY